MDGGLPLARAATRGRADSWRFHGGSVAFEDDRARDVDLRRRGYAVHRFSERQIRVEEVLVAADLAGALEG